MGSRRSGDIVNNVVARAKLELLETLAARQRGTNALRAENAARRPAITADRMSQTEVSLRLALHLIDQSLVSGDVVVSLTGHELERNNSPRFDVRAFLGVRGLAQATESGDWRGRYVRVAIRGRAEQAIVLHNRIGEGDVVARLSDGRRFFAEVGGGPIKPTRSPTEHRLLYGVIGRAVTTQCAMASDVICAVVPRSERTRALAAQWREAQRVKLSGIRLVTIDRAGAVHGL